MVHKMFILTACALTCLLPQISTREGIFKNEVTLPWLLAFSDEVTLLRAVIAASTSALRRPRLLFCSPSWLFVDTGGVVCVQEDSVGTSCQGNCPANCDSGMGSIFIVAQGVTLVTRSPIGICDADQLVYSGIRATEQTHMQP